MAILLLLGGFLAILHFTLDQDAAKEENQKISVAICGETNDAFLQMGLATVQNLGNTRYSLALQTMTERQAQKALASGQIAAFVVIPEGFMDAAMAGQLLPLKMVSTVGASGLVSFFKEEITRVIGAYLAGSEKGVFGLENAISQNGYPVSDRLDSLAFQYLDHIAVRDRIYDLRQLGIADSLGLQEYLCCGLSVLFLMLVCLTFGPLHIGKDPALGQLLRAKGYRGQTLCDFAAYLLILLPLSLVFLPIFGLQSSASLQFYAVFQVLPVVLMAAAYSFLLFQLSDNLMTGIVMQFLLTVGMCFVCGCIYPISFFPAGVQKMADLLPAGLARMQLAGCFTGESTLAAALGSVGYSALFLGCSIWVRSRKTREVRL